MQSILTGLSRYVVTIRSFHPRKSFGYSGFWFGGDDRGFSALPSTNPSVTSRINHSLEIDFANTDITSRVTYSDASKPPWTDEVYKYENKLVKPKSLLRHKSFYSSSDGKRYWAEIEGRYHGTNHAMPLSDEMKQQLGTTYVPSINVQYRLALELHRDERVLNVVAEITGDPFPNHEALIIGPNGKEVFLGGHVREGVPATSLPGKSNGNPLIYSAIQLPLASGGSFKHKVAQAGPSKRDARGRIKDSKLNYREIDHWNKDFTTRNPNAGRCMALETFSLEGCWP